MKALLILLVLLIPAWDLVWWFLGVRPLFPGRLKTMLKCENGRPILLDVRTAMEYKTFHIAGSRHYPTLLTDPGTFQAEDTEKPITVICMSGHRSPIAAYRLKRRGFNNVSYLMWGLIAWVLSGGETSRGSRGRIEKP